MTLIKELKRFFELSDTGEEMLETLDREFIFNPESKDKLGWHASELSSHLRWLFNSEAINREQNYIVIKEQLKAISGS